MRPDPIRAKTYEGDQPMPVNYSMQAVMLNVLTKLRSEFESAYTAANVAYYAPLGAPRGHFDRWADSTLESLHRLRSEIDTVLAAAENAKDMGRDAA